MLRLEHISKTFNPGTVNEKKALSNLDFTIQDNDFITVIGGNGAGKSTLMNIIAGTYRCDVGQIFLNQNNLTALPEHKRAQFISRVFQDPMMGTATEMWIEENLALASRRGKSRGLGWSITSEERAHYKQLLSRLGLGLENRLQQRVGLLSGGQRQALTLLMASLNHPQLMLLDEHTAALDPKTAAKVLELTERIVQESSLTTLMITHNMKDALRYGNRLIMLYDGKIVYDIGAEQKKHLQVSDLLQLFEQVSDGTFASDRMMLA